MSWKFSQKFSKTIYQKILFKFSQKASAKCENIGSQRAAKFVCENVVKIIETKCENVFKKAAKPKASQNVVKKHRKKCENEIMWKCDL